MKSEAPRIATLQLHQETLWRNRRNWEWLATALEMIACEIRKGEHQASRILAIYEAYSEQQQHQAHQEDRQPPAPAVLGAGHVD